jgi:peptidoglycan/LPS O-acetylase OafA/YrhL
MSRHLAWSVFVCVCLWLNKEKNINRILSISAMSNDGHNSVSLDAVWMDMLRSLAILAVVIHHWLLFNPYSSSVWIFTNTADLIQTLTGTVVHLFFILSGCGLTVSYFRKGSDSWREWAKRRVILGDAHKIITFLVDSWFLAFFALRKHRGLGGAGGFGLQEFPKTGTFVQKTGTFVQNVQ